MQRTVHFPWAAVVAIALAAIVLRALAFSGTELYSDEAYYWLWSLRPAAGYFDHPPLVAWLVAAGSPLLAGEQRREDHREAACEEEGSAHA